MTRKWTYIAGGVIAFLLLVALLLPALVDANSYRPKIEALLSESLNRKVTLGNIRLSILSGGVSVEDVSVSDDPAYGSSDFLKAASITVGVKLWPLIVSRTLQVTGITIEEPELTLLRSASGRWNFSSMGSSKNDSGGAGGSQSNEAGMSSAAANLSVARLTVRNGKLLVGDVATRSKLRGYNELNLEVSDLSYATQFPFEMSAQVPGGNGALKLSGRAGPLNQSNMAETPVDANLEVRNLDLIAAGLVESASGIKGGLDLTTRLNSDGKRAHLQGTLIARNMQLVAGGSPAGQPVELNYDADYRTQSQIGTLIRCEVHIGKALARLTGTFNNAGQTLSVQMKLSGENMPVSDLQSVLPAVGVTLPSGASLRDGTLNANLAINGPINRLVTTGPVNLANAKLAGYDMGSKMGALAAFAGVSKGSDTVIQVFSSDLRVTQQGIQADKLNLVVQGIGALTGNGTMAADRSLNFKMSAQLSNSASPLGGLAALAGGGQSGRGGIPFLIRGTASNPVFVPDVAGMASGIGKGVLDGGQSLPPGAQGLGGALGGLLGGRK